MSFTLRDAAPADLEALTRIAHTAKRRWGYPEAWIVAWRRELSVEPEDFTRQEFFVAEDLGREILGFAALLAEGESGQLEHLWVDPVSMGAGVGRALFEEAVRRAQAQGVRSLEIDSDPHALEFYRHMGAVEWGSVDAPMDGVPRTRPQLRYLMSRA